MIHINLYVKILSQRINKYLFSQEVKTASLHFFFFDITNLLSVDSKIIYFYLVLILIKYQVKVD